MTLAIMIEGREAIPVRAIPFITSQLSPDAVALALAHDETIFQPWFGEPIALKSYHFLEDGTPHVMLPSEWKRVIEALKSLSLHLKLDGAERVNKGQPIGYSSDDIMRQAHVLTKAEWNRKSVELLPAGVFVWRDDFEEAYRRAYPDYRDIENEQADDTGLNYSPWIPEELRRIVKEGFDFRNPQHEVQERLAGDAREAPPAPEQARSEAQEGSAGTDHAALMGRREVCKANRAELDITAMRGCPRSILEHWDMIEQLHGPNPNGRQVLKVLKRNTLDGEVLPDLKTVQNKLSELRNKGLIP